MDYPQEKITCHACGRSRYTTDGACDCQDCTVCGEAIPLDVAEDNDGLCDACYRAKIKAGLPRPGEFDALQPMYHVEREIGGEVRVMKLSEAILLCIGRGRCTITNESNGSKKTVRGVILGAAP